MPSSTTLTNSQVSNDRQLAGPALPFRRSLQRPLRQRYAGIHARAASQGDGCLHHRHWGLLPRLRMLLQHWQHALWIGMSLNRVALTFIKGPLINDVRNILGFSDISSSCHCHTHTTYRYPVLLFAFGPYPFPLSACGRHLRMDPNTSLLLKPGHRQMGLPNVFLAGGQSDVPHYFHFCRPRQLRPNRAVGAPHSGDANAIDGQSRQKARHLD